MAVHAQSPLGGQAAVRAGADSIEHGMHLPLDVLPEITSAGIALVPTATTFLTALLRMASQQVPPGLRAWYTSELKRHAELVRAAVAAGSSTGAEHGARART